MALWLGGALALMVVMLGAMAGLVYAGDQRCSVLRHKRLVGGPGQVELCQDCRTD